MPGFATGALKFVMSGDIGGAQTWSCGFWVAGEVTESTLDLAQVVALTKGFVSTWGDAVSDYWSTRTHLTDLGVYYYPAGSVVATRNFVGPLSTPSSGGHTTNLLPTYVSLVQTLRTALSGRSFRGRIYVPITSAALGQDGQMAITDITVVASKTRDLLSDVNDVDLTGVGVGDHSCVVASFTKGLTTPITAVFSDSLMDVQHRREDKIGATANITEFV